MKTAIRFRLPYLSVLLLAILLPVAALAARQPAFTAYQARLGTLAVQVPAISASAQQAAETILDHPGALLNVPYWEQMSFCEELMNRSGGLAHAYPTDNYGRVPTKYDVVLLSVRSWEAQRAMIIKRVHAYKAKGWTVTVIGSRTGMPKTLGADFFIDNGAPTTSAAEGRINVLANTTLGWMWCCEYAAAMSRRGKFPAVLQSICIPGASEYDATVQTQDGRHTVVDCPTAIPAGELARLYLRRIDTMMRDIASDQVLGQLQQAADICAQRLSTGGTVGISGMGHGIIQETMVENQAPFTGFRSVFAANTAFRMYLQPGDILVWMSYNGMNSKTDDYARFILAQKLQLVTCYAPDPIWSKDPPPSLAHIDQSWALPDAEVPIPVFPNWMAPISGINVILLSRMLDDEVGARLKAMHWQSGPERPIAPQILDAAGESLYANDMSGDAPMPERRWGLIDAGGKALTPRQYEWITMPREGLAAVCRQGKWGYLAATGAMAIAPSYDVAGPFAGGVARVGLGGKFGYIDTAGKVVVPLQYDALNEPYGMTLPPYAIARQGKDWLLLDRKGKVLLPAGYDAIAQFSEQCVVVRKGGKAGLISLAGGEVAAPQYDTIGRYRRGFATMQRNGKWGVLDAAGKELLSPAYDGIGDVAAGVALVRTGEKWGCVSLTGAAIIPPRYDAVGRFTDGMAPVRAGTKWGAVDAAGREMIPPRYDEFGLPGDGLLPVRTDDSWGYLDRNGAEVIPPRYETASSFANGMATVTLNKHLQFIDTAGKAITLPQYEYLAAGGDGIFKISRQGRWGFADKTGKEIVRPKYSCVLRFVGGRALVATGGRWTPTAAKYPMLIGARWGLVDAGGREIVAPRYDRIVPFGNNLFAVATNVELMLPQP